MTYNELVILKEEVPDTKLTINNIVAAAKGLFGEHKPYSVRLDIAGVEIILFNTHFTNCMRQALTDGCVARMSRYELKFWYEFVDYQNDIQDGIRDNNMLDISEIQAPKIQRELALEELNRWIFDEIAGIPHQEVKECYVPYIEEQ